MLLNKLISKLLVFIIILFVFLPNLNFNVLAEDGPSEGDKPTGAPTEELGAKFKFFDHFFLRSTGTKVSAVYDSPGSLINLLVGKFMLAMGSIMFFFLILFSGFRIAFSHDKKKVLSETKQYLTTGVIGLLIMVAAFWLVEIVGKLTKVEMPL